MCKVCNNLVEGVGEGVTGEIKTNVEEVYNRKLPIPGLHIDAEVKDCRDENLTPLNLPCPKTFQFGDTSIISSTTSDKD